MYQGLRNAVVKPLELDGALLGHLITDAKHELELFQHDLNISDLLSDVGGVVLATEVFLESSLVSSAISSMQTVHWLVLP
jgi:hypothetical protein